MFLVWEMAMSTAIVDYDSMKCPRCRELMQKGYLRAESLVGGAKWHRERNALASGGEKIMGTDLGGNVWLEGFRCDKCRTLVLHY